MGLEVEVVSETHKFDVIVVGGSFIGMLTTISLKHKGIKCAFLEKSVPGGKFRTVDKVENFLGVPSISGAMLCDQIFKHAVNDTKVSYFCADVQLIKQQPNSKFYLFSDNGKVWEAKIVIFACQPQQSIIQYLDKLKLSNDQFVVNMNLETNLKNFYAIDSNIWEKTASQQMQIATQVANDISKRLKLNNEN